MSSFVVGAGQTTSGITLSAGDTEASGVAFGATFGGGGTPTVLSGGMASDTIVFGGGSVVMPSGGAAGTSASDSEGGTEIVAGANPAGTEWSNSAGGDWTSAGNWTSGVPTSNTDATIGVTGSYTVSLTTTGAVDALTIDDTSATLDVSGGAASLAIGGDVVDSGDFELRSGAVVALSGGLSVASGGSLSVDSNGTGSKLSVALGLTDDGVVQIGGNIFTGGGDSTLDVAGTLVNSGTLDIFDDTASATVATVGDLVDSGTIDLTAFGGSAELIATAAVAPSTLSTTITLFGPSLLEYGAGGQIGTIGSGGALIVGNTSAYVADGGSTTSNSALSGLTSILSGGDFELRSGAVVALSGGLSVASGGSLSVDSNGTGSKLSVALGLTDDGVVQIGGNIFTGGGDSTLDVAGTLVNSGTLDIFDDTASATVATVGDLVDSGTIDLTAFGGSAELIATAAVAPSTLSTTITLFGPSLLEYGAGGQIGTIGSGGALIVGNTSAYVADGGSTTSNSALSGLTSILSGGDFELRSGAVVALSGGLSVTSGGSLSVDSNGTGSKLSVALGLTDDGVVQIGGNIFTGGGDSTLDVAGTLVNSGTLDIFDDTASATVATVGDLVDSGTIDLTAFSGSAELIATAGVAPSTLSTTIELFGPSLLDYGAGGQIGTIGSGGALIVGNISAYVADGGSTTSNSALSGLTSILSGGDFELRSGAVVALSGGLSVTSGGSLSLDSNGTGSELSVALGLTDDGVVQIGGNIFTGGGDSTLDVAGTLVNSGTLDIFDDTASATVATVGDLVDSGTIDLTAFSGSAELIATAGVAPSTLSTTIELFGPSLLDYGAGGQIGTIGSGGALIVGNISAYVADGGSTTSNSALSGLTSILSGGDFELRSGAVVALSGGLSVASGGSLSLDRNGTGSELSVALGLTDDGVVQIGGNIFTGGGDSTLDVAGTLVNSGTLDIFDDTASATVATVGDLVDSGTIDLTAFGGSAELIATAAVAPSTLSTTITLFGPSLLEYGAGGQIGTIGSGGALIVGNTSAYVADGGSTTSNSALSGLTSILSGGDFELRSGAVVALSGGLSVASGGSLSVDSNGTGSKLSVALGLTDDGVVQIGGNIFTGGGDSTLDVAGTLVNSGTLDIFDDTASATVATVGDLVDSGTIDLTAFGGSAELIVSGAVTDTGVISLSSNSILSAASLLVESGGSVHIGSGGDLATAVTVGSGGSEIVSSGGTIGAPAISGGTLDVAAGAVASGTIDLTGGGGTVVDAGTIGSGSGTAVSFGGNGGNRLVLDPGYALSGTIVGNAGTNTLELGSATSAGTLSALGTSFANFGTVAVDAGARWVLSGSDTIGAGVTLGNSGTLTVAGTLIDLGTLTNAGVLAGAGSLVVDPARLLNSGSIGLTVTLAGGGYLDNETTGRIAVATGNAVYGSGGAATIVNAGTMTATGGSGFGIDLTAGGTVVDSGTISGGGGTAIYFGGTGGNRLVLDPGYHLGGVVAEGASAGATNTLELGSAAGIGTLSAVLAAEFANFGTVTVDAGAQWKLTGSNSLAGITLTDLGTLTNAGTLAGAGSLVVDPASLVNTGSIGLTVTLSGGGTLDNEAGGTIAVAAGNAVYGSGGAATIVNAGTIATTSEIAINLAAGGTVSDSGTITGAIYFGLGGSNQLVLNPGYHLGGLVIGNYRAGATNTLELGSAASIGTLSAALATEFANFGTVTVAAGARWTLSAADAVGAGMTLTNYGTITGNPAGVNLEPTASAAGAALMNFGLVTGATGIIDSGAAGSVDTIVNSGTIAGTGGAGIVLGGGTDRVVNYGTITGADGTAVAFGTGSDTVVVEAGAVFTGTLAGFGAADLIDFAHVTATNFSFANGTLTILNDGTAIEKLAVSGNFTPPDLGLISDGNGGVEIGVRPLGPILPGTYFTPIQLSNPAISNSATVTDTGRITPAYGDAVVGGAGPGTVINLGTITAPGSANVGISLGAGGLVVNGTAGSSGGYISGSSAGIMLGGATGTVVNSGTITGGSGIVIGDATLATVTNSGTITGTGGTAVSLGGLTNRLIVDRGAAFTGIVDGGGGSSVLEISASGSGTGGTGGAVGAAGTIAYVTLGSVVNFSLLQVDPSATVAASGVLSIPTLVNQGQINIASGDDFAFASVSAATTGLIDLRTGGTVTFSGTVANQTLEFNPAGGKALIAEAGEFGATITGFTVGDTIDLTGFAAASRTFANNALVLTDTVSNHVTLDIQGSFTTSSFAIASDGGSGTDITAVACFCRGTRVRSGAGEVAVEDLAIGDRVVTLAGAARPVKWIGRRRYDPRFVAGNPAVLPIRITAGALAEGVPARDLWLSPEHALLVDGMLVPAGLLANGATIHQVERVERVEYFHIELDGHDVIFAEGAAAETYVDCDNRLMFQNGAEYAALYPDARPAPWQFCAPRVEPGSPGLTAIRAALLARAEGFGHRLDPDPDLHLIVDGRTIWPHSIAGERHRFRLPSGSRAVWLASRSAVPAEVETAGSRDRRRLGVPLARIALFDAERSIEAGHGDAALSDGFHADEGSQRWTNGRARLPDAWLRAFPGGAVLDVHLVPTGLAYRLPPPALAEAAA